MTVVDVVAELSSVGTIQVSQYAQATTNIAEDLNVNFGADCNVRLDMLDDNTIQTVGNITTAIQNCFFNTAGKYDEDSAAVEVRARAVYNMLKTQFSKYDTYIISDQSNAAAGYLKNQIADDRYKSLITLSYATGKEVETLYTEDMFLGQIRLIHGDMQGRIAADNGSVSTGTYKFYINHTITMSGETAAYKALVQAMFLTDSGAITVSVSMPLTNEIVLNFD